MATSSRNYYKNPFTLEVDTVTMFAQLTIGAAGAVSAIHGGGIAGAVKEAAAGKYTIALEDKFARLLMASAIGVDDAALTFGTVQIFQDGATLQADVKADGEITIQLLDFAGAAVNAASGTVLLIELKMRQSKIGRYDA